MTARGPARPGSHFGPGGMFGPGASRGAAPAAAPPPAPADEARAVLAAASRAVAAQNQREADAGEVLVSIPRADGTELRVSLHYFDPVARRGAWVRVAPWSGGWPVRGKGLALKLHEVAPVVLALGRLLPPAAPGGAPPAALPASTHTEADPDDGPEF